MDVGRAPLFADDVRYLENRFLYLAFCFWFWEDRELILSVLHDTQFESWAGQLDKVWECFHRSREPQARGKYSGLRTRVRFTIWKATFRVPKSLLSLSILPLIS